MPYRPCVLAVAISNLTSSAVRNSRERLARFFCLTGGPAGWNCNFPENDDWDFFIVDYQTQLTCQKILASFPKKVVFGNTAKMCSCWHK